MRKPRLSKDERAALEAGADVIETPSGWVWRHDLCASVHTFPTSLAASRAFLEVWVARRADKLARFRNKGV